LKPSAEIAIETSDKFSVSQTGAAGDGTSLITIAATPENTLLFKNETDTAAKTRVFSNRRGNITEADIVLSPFQQFSTDGTYGTFDLEAVVRHEIGHLLGLSHSPVVGSMMYDVIPRNGVFGETTAMHGRLTEDDLAAVRELYSAESEDDACCGTIAGRLSGFNKNSRGADIWLQDLADGATAGHGSAGKDGNFRVGGINSGSYAVYARELGRTIKYSPVLLGNVQIDRSSNINLSRKLPRRPIDFSIELMGKNGILSDSPVVLRGGGRHDISVGGFGLNAAYKIEVGSPDIVVDTESLSAVSYDGGLTGIRFSLVTGQAILPGVYDIWIVSPTGERDVIIGGISVVGE